MALVGGRFSSPYIQSCAKFNAIQQTADVKVRSYSELGVTSSSLRHHESKDSCSSQPLSFINPNYEPAEGDECRGRSQSEAAAPHALSVSWTHEPDICALTHRDTTAARVPSGDDTTSPPHDPERCRAASSGEVTAMTSTHCTRGRSSTEPIQSKQTSPAHGKNKKGGRSRALSIRSLLQHK